MTRTLRRERIKKFTEMISDSSLGRAAAGRFEEYQGCNWKEVFDSEVKELAEALADAAASRTEAQQEEVIEAADRKVDVILDFAKAETAAEAEGKAWRGREFLVGSEYCKYGDWWHGKTGLHMYGAKGKAKQDTSWLKAFKELHENEVTLKALDEAFEANQWRTLSNPLQIVNDAKAIQAAPPAATNTSPVTYDENGIPESW